MSTPLSRLEAIVSALDLSQRKQLSTQILELAADIGESPEGSAHLVKPLTEWPGRRKPVGKKVPKPPKPKTSAGPGSPALRYHVDFSHADPPDHRDYVATFDEVADLLGYTPASCQVALVFGKGRLDRSAPTAKMRRPKLGPCVVTKLKDPVDLAKHPLVRRLADRRLDLEQVKKRAGRPGPGQPY